MSYTDFSTLMDDDIQFQGTIHSKKSLKIKGKVKGKLEVHGVLLVAHSGNIDADIHVDAIYVEGKIHGNLNAKNKTVIQKTGYFKGEIQTKELEIHPGAKFNGTCFMKE